MNSPIHCKLGEVGFLLLCCGAPLFNQLDREGFLLAVHRVAVSAFYLGALSCGCAVMVLLYRACRSLLKADPQKATLTSSEII